MQTEKMNGMECPGCAGFIPIDIRQLLYEGAIVCPHCNLRLTVNRPQSQAALKALKKVDEAVKCVEKSSHFNR
ncbi:hypothetical protein [uncultured Odoribacter sp.]|uniref:hypothetical protein n=1 Tax=uncultured Odoribacter sp. TaxID=876416 RepID=UPI0026281450|nr:hypothetical protein [uncultured Odoribacter sp.]